MWSTCTGLITVMKSSAKVMDFRKWLWSWKSHAWNSIFWSKYFVIIMSVFCVNPVVVIDKILCLHICMHVYMYLSHALKNKANRRPGLPLHILRYVTGNMQRVVFHSTFPSLLARNSLLGSI